MTDTQSDLLRLKKVKFLLYSTFLLIPLLLIMTAVKFILGNYTPSLYLVPILAILLTSIPLVIKASGSYKLTVGLNLFAASTLIFYRTYETGGLSSYTVFWFFMVPFAISWFSNIKWLISLIIYQIGLITLLFLVEVDTVEIDEVTRYFMTLTGFICASLFAIVIEVNRRSESMLIKNLEDKGNSLKRVNDLNNIIGKMRHEINNPLMVIMGSIHRMKRDKNLDKLDLLDEQAKRVGDVIYKMQKLRQLGNNESIKRINISPILKKLGVNVKHNLYINGSYILIEDALTTILKDREIKFKIKDQTLYLESIFEFNDKKGSLIEYSRIIIDYHKGNTIITDSGISISIPII